MFKILKTRFSNFKPTGKNKADDNEIYKDKDVKVIRHIKSLLWWEVYNKRREAIRIESLFKWTK